ncbi:hypothetical protein HDV06_003517 [Boothiomyces sp. JEL0866]|nr:hypothetical protein HDV06_003485 [Boothiomyces sp. JEL0866]KAJ3325747.1 hypothetical protein HDV06_003517 [Boothiomyces sp. JEL0866]
MVMILGLAVAIVSFGVICRNKAVTNYNLGFIIAGCLFAAVFNQLVGLLMYFYVFDSLTDDQYLIVKAALELTVPGIVNATTLLLTIFMAIDLKKVKKEVGKAFTFMFLSLNIANAGLCGSWIAFTIISTICKTNSDIAMNIEILTYNSRGLIHFILVYAADWYCKVKVEEKPVVLPDRNMTLNEAESQHFNELWNTQQFVPRCSIVYELFYVIHLPFKLEELSYPSIESPDALAYTVYFLELTCQVAQATNMMLAAVISVLSHDVLCRNGSTSKYAIWLISLGCGLFSFVYIGIQTAITWNLDDESSKPIDFFFNIFMPSFSLTVGTTLTILIGIQLSNLKQGPGRAFGIMFFSLNISNMLTCCMLILFSILQFNSDTSTPATVISGIIGINAKGFLHYLLIYIPQLYLNFKDAQMANIFQANKDDHKQIWSSGTYKFNVLWNTAQESPNFPDAASAKVDSLFRIQSNSLLDIAHYDGKQVQRISSTSVSESLFRAKQIYNSNSLLGSLIKAVAILDLIYGLGFLLHSIIQMISLYQEVEYQTTQLWLSYAFNITKSVFDTAQFSLMVLAAVISIISYHIICRTGSTVDYNIYYVISGCLIVGFIYGLFYDILFQYVWTLDGKDADRFALPYTVTITLTSILIVITLTILIGKQLSQVKLGPRRVFKQMVFTLNISNVLACTPRMIYAIAGLIDATENSAIVVLDVISLNTRGLVHFLLLYFAHKYLMDRKVDPLPLHDVPVKGGDGNIPPASICSQLDIIPQSTLETPVSPDELCVSLGFSAPCMNSSDRVSGNETVGEYDERPLARNNSIVESHHDLEPLNFELSLGRSFT